MVNQIKWWIAIILALMVSAYFAQDSLSFMLNDQKDRSEVDQIATQYLNKTGIKLDGYHHRVLRQSNMTLVAYLKNRIGEDSTRQILKADKIPNLQWVVSFFKNIPKDQPQTTYSVQVSYTGKIVGFRRSLPDTMALPSLSESEAKQVAVSFIDQNTSIDLPAYELKKSNVNKLLNRTDYSFVWEKPSGFDDGHYTLTVSIQGDNVGRFQNVYDLPQAAQQIFSEKTTTGTFVFLLQIIGLIAVFVFTLILFLKKYHDGEIWVRMGVNLFIIIYLMGLIQSINEFPATGSGLSIANMSLVNVQIISFLYDILIKNIFLATLVLTAWAVGESYARAHSPQKLISIDAVLNKRFFTLATGNSLLRGGAIGFIIGSIYLIIITQATGQGSPLLQVSLPFGGIFQNFIPGISVILDAVVVAAIAEIVFRFFIINWLISKWEKRSLAILISALIWIIGQVIFSHLPVTSSQPVNLILTFVTGVVLGWLYLRYDLLTVISAQAAANLLFLTIPLLASQAAWHRISAVIVAVFVFIPALIIIISQLRKEEFQFSNFGIPSHIRRISERERMAKELEIARNVQMGLLPKESPKIQGYDISGICIPAKEVGGDYFDFVKLGENKLGIAIGDVSGKGVPAAIYMTLTKGILQSHADETISPKLVLNKVNKLMYRNIEKNSFVSMFYAVLDISDKKLTFARAGHNPGIIVNQLAGESHFLSTAGIALGLEEGAVFDKTLQEHTINLQSGDTLVFYTDGITEAMNSKQEEYGEDRFVELIAESRSNSATKLVEKIVQTVNTFTGGAAQHDDMTLVVIKIA